MLALVPVGRGIVDGLRTRGWLTASVGSAFVLGVVALGVSLRSRPKRMALLCLGAVVLGAATQLWPRVEERVHVLQYVVLGALCLRVVERPWRALALVAALGWLEEGVQYLVPHRVYDNADVALNAASGAVGVLATWAADRLEARGTR